VPAVGPCKVALQTWSALHVSNARLILVVLICALPAILLLDGAIVQGLVAAIAATGIVIVGRTMRPHETEFLVDVIRPIAAIATVPALWILVQVLPLKAIAHPIWSSAEAALGRPIASSISIDLGATVMALGQYLTIATVALLSAAVSVERQRAEWILFSLTGTSALMALIMATHDLFGLTFLSAGTASFERSQVIDCVAMGMIISAAASIRTIERLETRKTSPERSVPALLLTLGACAGTLAICLTALILGATGSAIIAAAYGLLALASVVAIRRLGFGPWGTAAIAVPAIGIAILVAGAEPGLHTKGVLLAHATAAPASLIAASQRMLDDAPLAGVGAGTFGAIAHIYREADDLATASAAPTTAAAIAIELGRPMLWLIAAAICAAIFALLRASLRRGRDSFHPAAGGSCLLALLFLGFVNAGLLGTAAATLAAVVIGLAFAQSKSRTVPQ
jgi:hypothetical protein